MVSISVNTMEHVRQTAELPMKLMLSIDVSNEAFASNSSAAKNHAAGHQLHPKLIQPAMAAIHGHIQEPASCAMLCFTGEDAKLKQMLWVVENLQEELFRAQEYRLQAEKKQQRHRSTINSLQVLVC